MHDSLLLPYVQTMYAKLIMNLIEPILTVTKQGEEPVIILIFKYILT